MQPVGNFYKVDATGFHLATDGLETDARQRGFFETNHSGLLPALRTPALRQRATPPDDPHVPGFYCDLGSRDRFHASSAGHLSRFSRRQLDDRLAGHPGSRSTSAPQVEADGNRKATPMSLETL